VERTVAAFLRDHRPSSREPIAWSNGLSFEFTSILTKDLPPLPLITSVRAILECNGEVLVFEDDLAPHVIPGGHRENGESLLESLERGIREETGCRITGAPRQLGVLHLRMLSPKPERHPYAYPDNFWLIYAASALAVAELSSQDARVQRPRFVPADAALALALPAAERAFLNAALAR